MLEPDRTTIVAELGSNHDRSMETAVALLDAAAAARVDAVKLQDFRAATLASGRFPSLRSAFEKVELPQSWVGDLAAMARERGLALFTTPFDEEAVRRAADLGLPMIKIASGDLTCHRLLRAAAEVGVPVILSTGAATMSEVASAVDALEGSGAKDIWILHCVSMYPTEPGAFTLGGMMALRSAFTHGVGISDHSPGSVVAVASVALGGRFIEKHLTLDRRSPGPDHGYALEPQELASLVSDVRTLESALAGGTVKGPLPGEASERFWARRGLCARRHLHAGSRLVSEDLVALRPCAGIGAEFEPAVVGRTLTREVQEGEELLWTHF